MSVLMMTLMLTSSACSGTKQTVQNESTDSSTKTEEVTSTTVDKESSVDESFGAVAPDTTVSDVSTDTDTDFEDTKSKSRETKSVRDHSGELIPPKHSTSEKPPKNPTDEDIGVEGDDTWYIKVGNSVIPNFEKHIGEDITFSVNGGKFKLSSSVKDIVKIVKKNGWEILGNWDRVIDTKFAPGEEMYLSIVDGDKTIMTIRTFNPYKNDYVRPTDFVPYYIVVNVGWLDEFNFLNVEYGEDLYDYQFIKKSVQFPIKIDEASIFCQVETGLGYAGFYDTGQGRLEGFIYYLSDEEKKKLIKEEYDAG